MGVVVGQLSRVHKQKDRFRERSEERLLAGHTEEDPGDTSKCRQTSPSRALRGKQKGKCAHFSDDEVSSVDKERSRRGSRGYRGPGGRRRMEDADVHCGGEGRHDGRKYNKPLFRKRERGRQLTP